jgi:hypothetical protein
MNTKWNFSLSKVIILFILGIGIGGEIVFVATSNISLLGGSLQIISTTCVSLVVLMSCRKRQEHN